uniref:Uncharacterized protein n=1 Tax=Megaselia scalaris TaxID=36166 RepID=T1H4F0_MEGSC
MERERINLIPLNGTDGLRHDGINLHLASTPINFLVYWIRDTNELDTAAFRRYVIATCDFAILEPLDSSIKDMENKKNLGLGVFNTSLKDINVLLTNWIIEDTNYNVHIV